MSLARPHQFLAPPPSLAGRPPGAAIAVSMRAAVQALAVILAATVVSPTAALAAGPAVERITWLTSDNTGMPGVSDPTGVTGAMIRLISKHWPQVKHDILIANTKRSWQMIENGQQVCRANVVRTPDREKVAYFINTQLTPPPQLIVRRDQVARLPRLASGEVQLPQLLANPQLRGALIDGRSYGTALDELLAHRPANAAVTFYAPRDFGGRVLQMLSLDRADYSIDYDMALVMAGDPKGLVSAPIHGASDLVMAGIACPRTAWGLEAIRGLDRALGRPEAAASLRRGLMRWVTPETQAHYAAQFDAFYRERAKPSKIEP
ncbi:TIGR02285 family protein [Roseateles amylovorans]|uniref:TIGR02285 family protein n=1 Tax=Roseateles amylovorans TaxID=2978473 RepID=A0ABY6B0G5_9BURK|nr:TIGR02285 family protein [Roseateles amylovorans]UXH78437.1 TIGR02285 family protein [Roseateles amylovorans]